MPSLSAAQKTKLQEIMTATGRSESDPVYVNGVEDKSASRRVEFKFSLKDSEMIEEMNRILSNEE
jgi:chemotaxis protein MotB